VTIRILDRIMLFTLHGNPGYDDNNNHFDKTAFSILNLCWIMAHFFNNFSNADFSLMKRLQT
jgi:hypothetical protein